MCYTFNDRMSAMRIFKTKWFAREASSHGISDDELYQAIQSALQGKVVDLGGFIKSDSTRIAIAQSSLPKAQVLVLYLSICQTGYGQYQPSRINGVS
jgi:hypothetical protein